jgi:hypothetical protein
MIVDDKSELQLARQDLQLHQEAFQSIEKHLQNQVGSPRERVGRTNRNQNGNTRVILDSCLLMISP